MQSSWTSPPTMAADLGITPSGVRAWLKRRGHTPDDDGRWRIDAATEAEMRTYFASASTLPPKKPCSVQGCDRPQRSRRQDLCSVHQRRMERHGSLDRQVPGGNQRAKTHCPNGHEYTPENTYTFSDGRRRCRTCRLKQTVASRRARRQASGA